MVSLTKYETGLVVAFSVIAGGAIERHYWIVVAACFVMIGALTYVATRSTTPQERKVVQ